MSYPTFVDVMMQQGIQYTSQAEYNAAWELYLLDLEDGETIDFETWLVDHVSSNLVAEY